MRREESWTKRSLEAVTFGFSLSPRKLLREPSGSNMRWWRCEEVAGQERKITSVIQQEGKINIIPWLRFGKEWKRILRGR